MKMMQSKFGEEEAFQVTESLASQMKLRNKWPWVSFLLGRGVISGYAIFPRKRQVRKMSDSSERITRQRMAPKRQKMRMPGSVSPLFPRPLLECTTFLHIFSRKECVTFPSLFNGRETENPSLKKQTAQSLNLLLFYRSLKIWSH